MARCTLKGAGGRLLAGRGRASEQNSSRMAKEVWWNAARFYSKSVRRRVQSVLSSRGTRRICVVRKWRWGWNYRPLILYFWRVRRLAKFMCSTSKKSMLNTERSNGSCDKSASYAIWQLLLPNDSAKSEVCLKRGRERYYYRRPTYRVSGPHSAVKHLRKGRRSTFPLREEKKSADSEGKIIQKRRSLWKVHQSTQFSDHLTSSRWSFTVHQDAMVWGFVVCGPNEALVVSG